MEDLYEEQAAEPHEKGHIKLLSEYCECQQRLGNGIPQSFVQALAVADLVISIATRGRYTVLRCSPLSR